MLFDDSHMLAYKLTLDEFAIVARTDRAGRILEVNDRFCEISKYERAELIGQTHRLLNSGFHPKSFFIDMWKTISAGTTWRGVIRNRAKDGSFYWVLTTIVPETDAAGRVSGYTAIRVDITAQRNAEDSLVLETRNRRNAEELLLDIIEAMPIGVGAYDQGDRLLLCNAAYRDMVPGARDNWGDGRTFNDVIRKSVASGALALPSKIPPDDLEKAVRATLKRYKTGGQASTHELTDGRWFQAQGRKTAKGVSVEVVTDISAIKQAESTIREQIKYDPVTEIYNRIGFDSEIETAISDYAKTGTAFALGLIDIDHFKRVNDRMGHAAGDAVLRGVARRLKGLPGIRCAARVGGDEFAVLIDMSGKDIGGLCKSAERGAAACFRPLSINGSMIDLSGSIGIAVFPDDGSDGETLTRAADMALLAAKRLGRSRVQLVNEEIKTQHTRYGIILDTLPAAIENRQITPAFQPVVTAHTHMLKGMEVLARWEHPEIGAVSPTEFIPIAQEAGLLSALDQMMMESACELAGDWLTSGMIKFLSLNASPTELATRGYATNLLATLRRVGIRPEQISMEILESAFIDDVPAVVRNLDRLHEAGVMIVLDDFGTGFSNLQAVMGLPLSGIKFDRSIIQRLDEEGMLSATINSMVQLFQSFGMYTVAEGIETDAHLEMAEKMNVSCLQGYMFGEALSFAYADLFVRSNHAFRMSVSAPAQVA
ncbi:EAL domain-containing protein [Hyphomonas oceanitis]|uniref:Signaling protein n=1 Tax=Hyphomonas oceanitis SCH89 TaxID=1280953 RepID=A0A059G8P1_9PROT|nr:EAL domain-containing protein [Hyphomonas oceanitis]KDA03222.1 signaling protein [Hyphomonas oceanitis SCH89]